MQKKMFLEEEDLDASISIDSSASMVWSEPIDEIVGKMLRATGVVK